MLFWKLSLASPLTFFQVKYCLAYQFLISCKIKTAIKTTNIHISKSDSQNQNLEHEHIFVVFFYDSSYTRRQKTSLNSWTGISSPGFFRPSDFQPGKGPAILDHFNIFLKKLWAGRDTGARHPSPAPIPAHEMQTKDFQDEALGSRIKAQETTLGN